MVHGGSCGELENECFIKSVVGIADENLVLSALLMFHKNYLNVCETFQFLNINS